MTMNHKQLEDVLEAYVLDLLDQETNLLVERSLAVHPDLHGRVAELRQTLGALAFGETTIPPPPLRQTTIDVAMTRREPGIGIDGITGTGPVQSYRETAAGLSSILAELSPDDFRAMTIYRRPVVELVAHLCAVEAYCGEVLGLASFDGDLTVGHVDLLDHTVDLSDPAAVVERWRRRSELISDRAGELTTAELKADVRFHGLPLRMDQLLVARAFELWTHGEDILRATERPLRPPSAAVLRCMADTAIEVLSAVVAEWRNDGISVRITLTGSGGGSWLLPLRDDVADRGGASAALLVADVVDFCRFVSDRIQPPAVLEAQRHGDEPLLDEMMRLAPTLADFGAGPHMR